jgi:hypothetical protein
LVFPDGTMELTQCIDVELLLDNVSEPDMLLSDIFAVTVIFQGESAAMTLGQVFTFDSANSGNKSYVLYYRHCMFLCCIFNIIS